MHICAYAYTYNMCLEEQSLVIPALESMLFKSSVFEIVISGQACTASRPSISKTQNEGVENLHIYKYMYMCIYDIYQHINI